MALRRILILPSPVAPQRRNGIATRTVRRSGARDNDRGRSERCIWTARKARLRGVAADDLGAACARDELLVLEQLGCAEDDATVSLHHAAFCAQDPRSRRAMEL